jgi:hypothetical protein
MTIDISKIKAGDYVTVRAKVTSLTSSIQVEAKNGYITHIHPGWITGHEPAPEPLKVGDLVTRETIGDSLTRYRVHAIVGMHGDRAWLLESNSDRYTDAPLSQLRRVKQP